MTSLFQLPGPFVADPDFVLYVGDVRDVLAKLPDASVDCCVTSPPYWGLRDYGASGQIGLEETPEVFVAALVAVFRDVRRLLKPHGSLWLNLGDSYAGSGPSGASYESETTKRRREQGTQDGVFRVSPTLRDRGLTYADKKPIPPPGLKPKDLVGIPWRVAFALQADGWYLRSDIVWSKPNPMPESVTDRPTKSHEYVFLLSKGPRYFFDQEAVREPFEMRPQNRFTSGENWKNGGGPHRRPDGASPGLSPPQDETIDGSEGEALRGPDGRRVTAVKGRDGSIQHREGERWPNGGRNVRSVWEIATQPYPDAHFATYPEALVERCLKAGCPEWVCGTCGIPRERIVEVESSWRSRSENGATRGNLAPEGLVGAGTQRAVHGAGVSHDLDSRRREVLGWSDCGHDNYRPGTVLDPFMGSGTTAKVARRLGRNAVGVELNPEYARLCAARLSQQSLLAEGAA